MGRISDIVPSLYFSGKNNLKKFLDALDVTVDELESKIKELPSLIDVDACPDDKLPYLAALTGCPLVGEDNILRRRQIRNWPHLLKLKGTQKSLELYLNSIGAGQHKIMTYFRDADGSYIETKPDGEPFKGADGLWYNIRTHYFGLEIVWDNHEYLRWQGWNEDLEERMAFWMKNFKPFYAELLKWYNLIYEQSNLNINVSTGLFISPYLTIEPALNDRADAKNFISVGTGLFSSKLRTIKSAQVDKSRSSFYFNNLTGLFNAKMHRVKPALNDRAAAKLSLKNLTGLFNAKFYQVKQALNTQSSDGAKLNTSGAGFCSKFYRINSIL
ncbi:MAG: hypothetical protein IJ667_12545 [Synergistaceae bacterium]|nr:hypothetical protein [Synergistaceae bacterium]